ncbi:transglycosylase domain-containing protein [Clostridium sp. AT4]|uniref:transglycosylase domain-containing protein n=1 Tax=Clostridium sp. AT4 TaxID=1720194 RepID=UPI00082F332E|nr:transglycosylase domain-containing protein [Clostridium sp. AT4]
MNINKKQKLQTPGSRRRLVTALGITGWLFKGVLSVFTTAFLIMTAAGLILYAAVKPELDKCREIAYDKLAQMDRSDFSMLSDTVIYDKDGKQIGLINAGHYQYMDINHISMNLQNGYIAQEDRRFKNHNGVDWIATFRAGLALIKHGGEVTQGGSTITQQVIKNTYLTQERTFTRKIVEILLAPELEKKYSKADIMEFYCNTNFYGHRCYGVEAASLYYFGKHAEDLAPEEAAVLIGISNSPSAYDPVSHPDASKNKRDDVLKSMNEVGYLSNEDYEKAVSSPLKIVQKETEGTDENYQSSYAIHCAALELMKMDGFEFQYTFDNKEDYTLYSERYTAAYSEQSDRIRAGGFQIYTSLDSGLQAVLQTQIDASLSGFTELQENGKFALQGAGVIVDNKTNYVTAIVGGRGADDPFNRAYLSARQPGSTIKPLIDYGPAFDTGEYYPTRMVNDHKWEKGPSNSGRRYFGNVTVREALNRSLNTVAWQILEDIGIDFGLSYLGEMEFQKLSYVDNQVPSLSIGGFTNGVRVVDMAKGYSTLANGGVYNDRTCIVKILHEKESELTKDMTPFAKQVYRSDSAFMLTDVLKGTFTSPYGTGRGLGLENDMPAAGKTGTTNSSKDTWFCGYTPYYTAAVWVGYDIPRNMPGIYGATYAGKIWKNVMDEIHQGLPPLDWEQPDTVERRSDETNGIEDYFSTTAQFRAQQSLHEKEQAALLEELTQEAEAFCAREIRSVEDTYTVKDEYASITSRLPLLDDGEQRALLLEQTEQRYDYFVSIISQMGDEIRRYEEQKAAEEKKAREEAAKEAEKQRLEEDKATKKNSFLLALETVEELEYQREDAERLVNDAIDKLSLIAGDPEADALSDRLQTAISRISTLPTAEEWEKLQAQEAEQEAKKEQETQLEIQSSQARLRSSLSRERFKWNNMEYYGPGGRGDE